VDLRARLRAAPTGAGTASSWQHAVDSLRVVGTPDAVTTETIKSFDRRRGADHAQLDAVLAALDAGCPVAFYGWWPTRAAATTTEILGIDAMEVPPPDRKGVHLVDGHAVVIVGYGRHDAFPGGGYVIVRSGWAAAGWGDDGDGYMPFTYLRAYATELCTLRRPGGGGASRTAQAVAPPRLPILPPRTATDVEIDRQARCADPRASLTHLFFSDDVVELARARAICSRCEAREPCLRRAVDRKEPWGVWGGELIIDGVVVAEKRGRGRPPKVPRPRLVVDEVTGAPVPIAV
jgi:WhiB family redox-sensing transcriptional regulator